MDIRHSFRRGMLDAVMAALGKSPRRCRGCGRRFYVPKSATREEERGAEPGELCLNLDPEAV